MPWQQDSDDVRDCLNCRRDCQQANQTAQSAVWRSKSRVISDRAL